MIPDPNQPPPPATLVDPNNGGRSLQTWQITLIIVACLVVSVAIAAVILVGQLKKKRKRKGRADSDLFGSGVATTNAINANAAGGGDSMFESELTESGGENRTIIAPTAAGGLQTRWSNFFKFPRLWSSSPSGGYHGASSQGHSGISGGIGNSSGVGNGGAGGPGGLWLMEENDQHQDDTVVAAAAMYPVSYQNDFYSGVGGGGYGEGSYAVDLSGVQQQQPDMAEIRHAHYQQQEQQHYQHQQQLMSSAMYPVTAQLSPTRLSPSLSHPEGRSPSPNGGGSSISGVNTTTSSSQHILQPFYEERLLEDNPDYLDGVGFGNNPSQRQSIETDFLSVSSGPERRGSGVGVGVGSFNIVNRGGSGRGAAENASAGGNRASAFVDPDQLESNALYEHIRAGPQALPTASDAADSQENTLPTTIPTDP
ncbi:hypothetical protein BGX26_004537 [Mortierella sp. AD094]|nr:hypothetical protein BGX26_004537 [Mortierella sp. AD094]